MNGSRAPQWLKQPILLRPDNFTPLSRTPWASQMLARTIKKHVLPPAKANLAIGESWEFSCDALFPSGLSQPWLDLAAANTPKPVIQTLPDLVSRFPEWILSPRLARRGTAAMCEILVKLVSPKDPLSLQVHPEDGDPGLKEDECGKPESWLVLAADEGSGVYLGFKKPVSRHDLRLFLQNPEDTAVVATLLNFVPVKPGDFFEIGPGVVHAIGPGLTILEPQRIRFGQSGKTFRLWDWGRRYDAAGQLDLEGGEPRPLHVEESLRLIDPMTQVGEAFSDKLRRLPSRRDEALGLTVSRFPDNGNYQTIWLEGRAGAKAFLSVDDGYGALIVISGSFHAQGQELEMGQPALLPHCAMPLALELREMGTAALVIPSGSTCRISSMS